MEDEQTEDSPENINSVERGASGNTALPLAERDAAWDGPEATKRVFEWARTAKGEIDAAKAKQCFFWVDPDHEAIQSGYKLIYCGIVDGKATIVPKGVFGCAGALRGARGTGVSIPSGDVSAVEGKINAVYARMRSEFKDPSLTSPLEDKEQPRMTNPVIVRADGSHDPMTGSHSHSHPAFGSQGGDKTHEHEHSHDGDADHKHSHEDGARADAPAVTASMYVPITRIDTDKRIVEGQATSDVIDHYGTIFDYNSSKRAFQQWQGNIREMHDPKKAVGRAIDIEHDDTDRKIFVRARISKGAPDTWEKVLDGTLSGFSIGAHWNGQKPVIEQVERNGRAIPVYKDYALAELSLVDSAGSPGCDIRVVRADGIATDVLAEDEPAVSEQAQNRAERAGARLSTDTQAALHNARDGMVQQARDLMALCGCAVCQGAIDILDPDHDGDVDALGGIGDTDNDAPNVMQAASDRELEPVIQRLLAPTLSRVNAMCARIAATPQTTPTTTIDTGAIERRLDAIDQRTTDVARSADIAEVRSLLSEVKELATGVKDLTERIAAQPAAGGPIPNAAAMDKLLAGGAGGKGAAAISDTDLVRLAHERGMLQSQEDMVTGAARQIRESIFGAQR